jgi:choline transport protein
MQKVSAPERIVDSNRVKNKGPGADGLINASGHRQELDRNFHFINICGLGITSGNTLIAIGGSIVSSSRSPAKPEDN